MCIFCSIIHREIPGSIIYEDDTLIAFLDISQVSKGHTLIVPKKHVANLLLCDDETLQHMMKIAKMIANHLMDKLDAKGMNVLSNINEVAGQSVSHFHVHLIPRYSKEDAIEILFHESEPCDLIALHNILKIT